MEPPVEEDRGRAESSWTASFAPCSCVFPPCQCRSCSTALRLRLPLFELNDSFSHLSRPACKTSLNDRVVIAILTGLLEGLGRWPWKQSRGR